MDNSNKKTILFLIFAVGKANGGHYRSLRMISESFSNDYNIIILNIGYVYSPIINKSPLESYFICFNGFNFFKTVRKIKSIFKGRHIDYIHSFDYQSFFIARLLSNYYKKPSILTKCGGPSPSGYFPVANYITVFSNEDYQYFKINEKYNKSSIKLIPNRVEDFTSNFSKIQKLKEDFNLDGKKIFLRIGRICQFYSKSFNQSINLVLELSKKNPDIVLLIVGNIQDQNVYEELKDRIKNVNNIFLIVENEFTEDAKEIIEVADFVIGTGRGFMEACSKSRIMLSSSIKGDFPVLITDNNFRTAFDKNFSERIVFEVDTIINNLKNIGNVLNSKKESEAAQLKSLEWFEIYFSLNKAKIYYEDLYNSSYYIKENNKDLIFHWFFIIKNNLGTWLRIFKSFF